MTTSTPNNPKVGDLILDNSSFGTELGIITLIETGLSKTLYFVEWSSGGMCGYTTAHELRDIQRWRKNLHKKT